VLSGNHQCVYNNDNQLITSITWILGSVWEVLVLCLAVWIAIKHFRELQSPSTAWIVRDCFSVLIQSHVFYFAGLVVVSCFAFGYLSPMISGSSSIGAVIYCGILEIAQVMQMFVLGPRLILSIRAYNAKLVDNSDEGTARETL